MAAKKAKKKPAAKKSAPKRKGAVKAAAKRKAPARAAAKKTKAASRKAPTKKKAPARSAAKRTAPAKAVAKRKTPARATRKAAAPKLPPSVTVPAPAPRSLSQAPALGEGEVEVSGVYGTVRYNEADPLAEVKEIFGHYDRDKSGQIEAKEFARLLEALGMELEEHDLKVAILDVDHDGDGKINWAEFAEWWRGMRS